MNTLAVFLFKREWLLKKHSFTILLVFNLILFALYHVLESYAIGDQKMIVALKMPVLSQLVFICLLTIFQKIYKRDPVDTFWSTDIRLMNDGIFNFFFWVVGIILPAILVFKKVI